MRTNSSSALILLLLGFDDRLLLLPICAGASSSVIGAQAHLDLVVDVLGHQHHFLDDLLLVIKFAESVSAVSCRAS